MYICFFFFSSRRRHTRWNCDWSSDVCSSDLARCHTHKYDPIQHREYYGLYALFNNLDESIMDGNRPNPNPFIKLPTKEQTERQQWLKKHIDEGRAKFGLPMPELDAQQARWANQWHEKLNRSEE